MNAKLQMIKKLKSAVAILTISLTFACLAMGQLSSANSISEELKNLDKIIKEIHWEKESSYLLYPGTGAMLSEAEEIQDIEIWMVDLNCWNSGTADEMKELKCTQDIEYIYSVEDWMLQSYSLVTKTYLQPETEDNYNVESWMYNMQEFRDMD